MIIGRNFSRLILLFAATTLAVSASGATRTVLVGQGINNIFVPANTNIAVNDTVNWVWSSGIHTTTSDTGLWDSSPAVGPPHSFSFTFINAGNFPYHCVPHQFFGMTGSINVTSPPSPPIVTITNPPNNITLSQPASFTLAASASDSDGTVTNVHFMQFSSNLGDDSTSPY